MDQSATYKYCYTQEQETEILMDYVRGHITSPPLYHEIDQHVNHCSYCQETILEIKQFLHPTPISEQKQDQQHSNQEASQNYHFNLWLSSLKLQLKGYLLRLPQQLSYQFQFYIKQNESRWGLMAIIPMLFLLLIGISFYISTPQAKDIKANYHYPNNDPIAQLAEVSPSLWVDLAPNHLVDFPQ